MEDVLLDNAFTVTQVNTYLSERFSSDENLRMICVKGEVSNFVNHVKTGHFYFTLKDQSSSIRAVMFKGNASKVPFSVENGMNVIIKGSVQVFVRDGTYQLYCQTLEPDGVGALFLAFEQLKEKLSRQGLFDEEHKKPLPKYPKKIGVVTAKTGAALQDIINILKRRYPIGIIVLFPALVQGENAPDSIVDGINKANEQNDIDVLIVGRGGGSIEDLWGFNSEKVAVAIYNSKIPIISAVGHEIDFTIADFAADLRAPTPSAAAELCAPSVVDIKIMIDQLSYKQNGLITAYLGKSYDRLKANYARLLASSPEESIKSKALLVNTKLSRLDAAMEFLLHKKSTAVSDAVSTLEALSPLKVLARGYAIALVNDKPVTKISEVSNGDKLVTKLCDGYIYSTVTSLENAKNSENTAENTEGENYGS